MAKKLIELEKNYSNPPKESERAVVFGLRGGACVLMVAAFEEFLRSVLEEHLSDLTIQPVKVPFHQLPEEMQVSSVYNSLELAMKGPRYQDPPPKIKRLADIEKACRIYIGGTIDPSSFGNTGGNPHSKTVKSIWKQIGIPDVLQKIKGDFEKKWKQPVAETFIQDKLDEIVNRRHRIAHTADASDVTRSQLNESIKFLGVVAELLDSVTRNKVKDILKSAN